MTTCKFCGKECKNSNSYKNHERRCKLNPDRKLSGIGLNPELRATGEYSNQYLRARKLGLPEPTVSDEVRKKISDANKSRGAEWHKNNGKRISDAVKKKVEEGTWHTSLAKKMHYEYNGNDLHGQWELRYAKYLDSNLIKWIRNKDSFPYVFDNKERRYTPDFYLPDTDEYIEIKGYKTEKDDAKWSQFPSHRKLVVLMKNDLKALNIEV